MTIQNENIVPVNPPELMAILEIIIQAHLTGLIVGPPGVGKTQITGQAATRVGFKRQIFMHPIYGDQTLTSGIPVPNMLDGTIKWVPYGDMADVLSSTEPTLWMIDDAGQLTTMQQAALMQPVLERKTGAGHKIPDCVSIVAATNSRQDKSGVTGLLEALKSRFRTILHLEPSKEAMIAYAREQQWDPRLIGFLSGRPELIHQFIPTADIINFPCPRTWEGINMLLKEPIPTALRLPTYSGTVGKGPAHEFITHLDRFALLPPLSVFINDPMGAPIPPDGSILYAICVALVNAADKRNFGAIIKYSERLVQNGLADMAFMTIHDITRLKKDLCNTAEYVHLQTSEFGRRLIQTV